MEADIEGKRANKPVAEVTRDPKVERAAIKKKRETLKAEKTFRERVRLYWELSELHRKAVLRFVKSRGFLVLAIVFFAQMIGFVLGQWFSSVFVILLGIAASALIYRIYSVLEKDRDVILEDIDGMKVLEDRSRALLESALDCVFTLDLQGNITSFNRKAEQVTGYSKRDVLGNSLGMFLPPEGMKDFFDKLHQAISTGVVPKYELDVNTIYGRRDFEMNLIAIKNRDGVIGVQGVARDITDKKKLEKELKMKKSDLNRWSKRAVDKEMTILEMKNQIKAIKKELGRYGGDNS
ncbi:MAG: PAS domain S-box protein [Candidatus Hydrothermarchaeaceae archaeon]